MLSTIIHNKNILFFQLWKECIKDEKKDSILNRVYLLDKSKHEKIKKEKSMFLKLSVIIKKVNVLIAFFPRARTFKTHTLLQ